MHYNCLRFTRQSHYLCASNEFVAQPSSSFFKNLMGMNPIWKYQAGTLALTIKMSATGKIVVFVVLLHNYALG